MTKLYLIRHGSRVDHEDRSWGKTAERPHDPPISEKGWKQARLTAQFLRDREISAVYASPFLRTIQTATPICEALDLPMFIEGGLSEWLNPRWHDYSAGCLSPAQLKADYPRIDLGYQSLIMPRYPEKEETVIDRYTYTAKQLYSEAEKRGGDIILISHGFSVYSLATFLANVVKRKKEHYCGINIFEHKISKWHLTFSSTDHLDQPEDSVDFI